MILEFDEYIWKISENTKSVKEEISRKTVHEEWNVKFGVGVTASEDSLKAMICALVGQDAHCPHSDSLNVYFVRRAPNFIWAIACGDFKNREYYSVRLDLHKPLDLNDSTN